MRFWILIKMADVDLHEWKRKARRFHQEMFVRLGDRKWDAIPTYNQTLLQRKTGFALFGPPSRLPVKTCSNDEQGNHVGYDDSQLEEINKYCDAIVKNSYVIHSNIYISCVFIVAMAGGKDELIPVFKVLQTKNETKIVIKHCKTGAIVD